MLKTIAIIPDGNRRWAKNKNLKVWEGHYKGAERFKELVETAFNLDIKELSIWGSSVNNLTKRSVKEVKELINVYKKYFSSLLDNKIIKEKKVQINFIGRWREFLPKNLIEILDQIILNTQNYNVYKLNFLLAYNGDDDILEAIKNIIKKNIKNPQKEDISNNLLTNKISNIDLIIRTGIEGDPHNSAGFLMWQSQNSQYYFTEKYFPDFDSQLFKKIIDDYNLRDRRLGK